MTASRNRQPEVPVHYYTPQLQTCTSPIHSLIISRPTVSSRPSIHWTPFSCTSDMAFADHCARLQIIFTHLLTYLSIPSVLWHCWLGGRKGIRPVKNWVVGCWHGYLSAARCRLTYGPADATATHCLASVKSRLVLPFWYRLTRVVPEEGPLNVCVCYLPTYSNYSRHSPAPTMPMARIALWATSASLSCENLLRTSRTCRRGLDAETSARASGTARLITGSP